LRETRVCEEEGSKKCKTAERSETCNEKRQIRMISMQGGRLAIKKLSLTRSEKVTLSLFSRVLSQKADASTRRSIILHEVYALGCSVLLVKLLYTIPVPLIASPAVSIKIPGASMK
jgi:hypothetical protein